MNQVPVVTLDGPGGSGKGTVARFVARRMGFHLLDSGALYRLVALSARNKGVALDNEQALAALALALDVVFPVSAPEKVLLDGLDVSADIRTEKTGASASEVAALKSVREALLERQKSFRQLPGLVADGRDMGTVVFPDAVLKIYLTATAEERAERRYKQLINKGENVNLRALLEDIRLRDERDMNRSVAPLRAAEDALVIDSTQMTIQEVVNAVLAAATEKGLQTGA
ncbi:MAG: (d)CMP kinase [Pseudomonadales bacterium]|nr:(d)CMP kinase [Pseudomonadales bacterium]